MKRVMIAGIGSGSGKSVFAAAAACAFIKKGLRVKVCKCGPDYIDPLLHNRILSRCAFAEQNEKSIRPSFSDASVGGLNIDPFLQGRKGAAKLFDRLAGDTQLVILEGAMGYFDGIGLSSQNSARDIAGLTDTPVILVMKPGGMGATLGALLKGMLEYDSKASGNRNGNYIAGVILNECKESHYKYLRPVIETAGLKALGYLPRLEEAGIESRHLGLAAVLESDYKELYEKFDLISDKLLETVDLDGILEISAEDDGSVKAARAEENGDGPHTADCTGRSGRLADSFGKRARIAVAADDAFCFYYASSLSALKEAGAELCFFSPVKDAGLPEGISGLYLGGGYPELFLKELSENKGMREDIRSAVTNGMPFIAECGGFMYLHERIYPAGEGQQAGDIPRKGCEMAGLIEGECRFLGALKRFGYVYLTTDKPSMLFREGERLPAHEFHYYDSTAVSSMGSDAGALMPALPKQDCREIIAGKVSGTGRWRAGFAGESFYAGFPHLELSGEQGLAARFVRKAEEYRDRP